MITTRQKICKILLESENRWLLDGPTNTRLVYLTKNTKFFLFDQGYRIGTLCIYGWAEIKLTRKRNDLRLRLVCDMHDDPQLLDYNTMRNIAYTEYINLSQVGDLEHPKCSN